MSAGSSGGDSSNERRKEELRKLIEDVESALFVRTSELQDVADSNGKFKEMV
jgi:hypothetical protein